jgi:FixJ family two-component response regulator
MSLPITTGIVEGYTTGSASMAHVLGRPLAEPPISHTTPIVFVVDDDVVMRESLERLIRSQGWRSETFASAQEFLSVPRASVPCCLILDISLSGPFGLELQKRFAIEWRHLPIIFVTHHVDVRITVQAMKAGAVEFLTKPLRQELLLSAIREAIARSRSTLGQEAEMQILRNRYASLTPREQQVMALVVSGLLNKQVGWELAISEQTVKTHRGRVMQKMNVESFAGLVKMATKLGLAAAPRPQNSAELTVQPFCTEACTQSRSGL